MPMSALGGKWLSLGTCTGTGRFCWVPLYGVCGRVTRASPDEPSMARRGFLLPSVAAKRCRGQYKPRSNHGRFVRGVRVWLQTSPQGNLEPLILVQRNQPAPPRHNHRRFCHFPTGIHISYRKFRHFPTGIHIPITMQG